MTEFPVLLRRPDIGPWREGNTGVPGFTTFTASRAGPHVVLLALMHGNELAGAICLDRLLNGGFRPDAGRLTFGFGNLAAFDRFDPAYPTRSRYVDEDLNRVWDPAMLEAPERSCERDRARVMWDLLQTADIVLDLHSMLWPSAPLLLSGQNEATIALCRSIGAPSLIVSDAGHCTGKRLIDHPLFSDAASGRRAILLEAGQHWQPATVDETENFVMQALRQAGTIDGSAHDAPTPPVVARVTHTITAQTPRFAFIHPFVGGDIIAKQETLLARDGDIDIRTPYDNCMLIMPNPLPGTGHTAVRLAYLEEGRSS